MRQAGARGDLDDFVQLRAVGVDPAFVTRVRLSGMKSTSADDLVEIRARRDAQDPGTARATGSADSLVALPQRWNPDPDG